MAEAGSILVVEDDAGIRAMLVEYLGTHGYAVAEAGDGGSMRAALERAVPDVVLLDVNLPGEDGLTLARFLRERHDVGIVMVTGASDVVDRVAGLEVGADDYVTKPFDLRELRARIKSVMRRVRERPAATPDPRGPARPGPGRTAARAHRIGLARP
jgi:two-component system phosphate regulon response regulator OmpR